MQIRYMSSSSKLKKIRYFSSESVGKGHPDKICDQISDSILDHILAQDKKAKVAIEVMASHRLIIIGGELTTSAYVDLVKCAWKILLHLGYSETDFSIISNVNSQSIEIQKSVEISKTILGAGDQGIMFGYATDETKEFMPLALVVANKLLITAEKLRIKQKLSWIKADMKSQIILFYDQNNKAHIETVLMSVQHKKNVSLDIIKADLLKSVIKPIIENFFPDDINYNVLINPSGSFTIGGPIADTGLTGRKIIVDTYGGAARHGGGAFSGKDPTKVDRSAAYAARWIAKHIVAAKLAKRAEVQLSYGIGLVQPLSVEIETFNTETISKEQIKNIILKVFKLSPYSIIKELDLLRPIYSQIATYGHFGRDDLNLPWEKLTKLEEIKNLMK